MYHPEVAYEFGKERQLRFERAAQEDSAVVAWLARLLETARASRRQLG